MSIVLYLENCQINIAFVAAWLSALFVDNITADNKYNIIVDLLVSGAKMIEANSQT